MKYHHVALNISIFTYLDLLGHCFRLYRKIMKIKNAGSKMVANIFQNVVELRKKSVFRSFWGWKFWFWCQSLKKIWNDKTKITVKSFYTCLILKTDTRFVIRDFKKRFHKYLSGYFKVFYIIISVAVIGRGKNYF